MKIRSGVEQGASILAMLGTQIEEAPVKSEIISSRLDTSPSYLKKVIRKLVVAGLVNSVSGNNGGFTLAKRADQITVSDLLLAIEGDEKFIELDGLLQSIFPESNVASTGEGILQDIFDQAQKQYLSTLHQVTLDTILCETIGTASYRRINWNEPVDQELFQSLQNAIKKGRY
ncbi:Rrf2 family transcriptional regulator [Salipaludibacillus neizhouensis]|nr:Rrf2 family transcriptional regulator [Salipaludibacillus neizhouensis]